MKKLFLLFIITNLVYSFSYTQNQCNFYKDGGTVPVKEVTCDEFSSITVKVPVPADVKNYDEFQYKLLLSSLDVAARVYFSKSDISSKLVGKKEITFNVYDSKNKSDFRFGDETPLSIKDLCFYPSQKGMKEITATVWAVGYKIVDYKAVTKWDDKQNAYVTEKVPIWDKGTTYEFSGNELKIIEKLIDGIQDDEQIITVKMINPDKSKKTYLSNYRDTYSHIGITDNSMGFPVTVYFLIYKKDLETIKNDYLKLFSTYSDAIQADCQWTYKFELDTKQIEWMCKNETSKKETEINIKNILKKNTQKEDTQTENKSSSGFTPVTLNGRTFDNKRFYHKYDIAYSSGYNKFIPGFLLDFYATKEGDYTIVAVGVVKDPNQQNIIPPEKIDQAQELIRQIISTMKVNK